MSFTNDYLFEEVFVLGPQFPEEDSDTLVITKSFSDIISYLNDLPDTPEALITKADLMVYHGVIVPACFIYYKMNTLDNLWLFNLKEEIEVINQIEYIETEGNFHEITFKSLKDISSFIEEKVKEKYYSMSDLSILMGYEMKIASIVESEDIDEGAMDPIKKIANNIKEILTIIEKAEDKAIADTIDTIAPNDDDDDDINYSDMGLGLSTFQHGVPV